MKQQLVEGLEIYDRSSSSIFLSSLTAGLEIGFSYLLLCTLFHFLNGHFSFDTIYKLQSLVYPVGFILVIMGQSILFTEQTSLLTLPVLNNKLSIGSLMKLWGVVISGNLVGGCLMAILLTWIGPQLGLFDEFSITNIALHVSSSPVYVIFVSAILAGWLMGLLSWLITSARDTFSRITLIFMVTGTMAFTGLHHSIIGNVEVFGGFLTSPAIQFTDYLSFQLLALFGNAIGGGFFVALLKYRAFVYDIGVRR